MTQQPAEFDLPQPPSPGAPLSITVAHNNGQLVLEVHGAIDLDTRQHFSEFLTTAVEQSGSVVVDLHGVEFMGSVALTALVEAANRARLYGERLSVRRPSLLARRVLEISGVDLVIDIEDDDRSDLR
jgi:anti-sigma B factor antagonist